MAGELTKSLPGDSRQWAITFLTSSIVLFFLGITFGMQFYVTEGGAQPDWWFYMAIGLLGIVSVLTWIQAWVNESVLIGIIITAAPPAGFALGASRLTYFSFLAYFIIAFFWSGMAGSIGHYLGYESANHYGRPDVLG